MLSDDARTKATLYQNANTALYRAKAAGRGQYRFFEADMAAEAKQRMALEVALRHARERGELEVHYQPQVDLRSGRVVGLEALLRWRHPVWGLVSPARFIPVAEETGMIVTIGAWVLRTACRQAAAWRAAGIGDLRIAVNLSARQFAQPNLVQTVASVLEESGLAAELLDLELTESMVMNDLDRTVDVLARLKDLGLKLSVDDFGTGYSSLAYLKRFPIDMLKIDRSFVREISHDAHDAAISDAIIAMAHRLGLRVIAEGVETEAQCEVLSGRKCDEIQGYLFSPALPADEVERLIRSGRTLPSHLLAHAAAR
jgi:EAL domain-containing protein (putative c-di-GMP-specific phosphodiesterase class I)